MSGATRRVTSAATATATATTGAVDEDDVERYSDADAASDDSARSDQEGRDAESDEYGSAERSADDDEEDDDDDEDENAPDDNKTDEAGNQIKSQVVDHDEDRRNPQYIPKKGTFYEHDDRTAPGAEEDSVTEISDNMNVLDISRTDRSGPNDANDKAPTPVASTERRKPAKSSSDRWLHDKYNENDQAPKSSDELRSIYGYDIRGEEGPPKAFRRHRYGRGPNKYTRNWEDENAYGKGLPNVTRAPKTPPSVTNGKEFPALQSKNDRNRIEKRKKVEKKIHLIDGNKVSDKNANDKIVHDNKVFINRSNKIDRDLQEKIIITDEIPRWKNRVPQKSEIRKPGVVLKNQLQPQEQTKWPESSQINLPPKPLSVTTSQLQSNQLPPAIVPLQENKLPPARKLTQNQTTPRMQSVPATTIASTANVTPPQATATQADAATRGKRYSNLRQRPMPETYQTHQQQYIADYPTTAIPKKSNSTQSAVANIGSLPHQQAPSSPLLQSTSHHQMHQQTAPPPLHSSGSQIHQKSSQIHQQAQSQIHQQNTQQIIQQTAAAQIHQQSSGQLHQQATQIHQPTTQIHQQTSQILQQNTQIHQQPTQIHQSTTAQMHQQSAQIHQSTPPIHQQTPPPTLQQGQTHHQTPPPAHQSINRQQTALPMRQVPRTHQQQMTLHSMSIQQGGLVASQSYGTPQIMAQNQYIQSPNGAVYGHVVPQVYPPPPTYAAPQHQPIPPQAMPPQALPPQAIPPQALPPQAMPPQALPPHTFHHQTTAAQHPSPYASHTGRSVFREPSGITYYSPQEQKGAAPPTRRPTSAIPIVPPPSKDRKSSETLLPLADNIDHIVDNMFVPRQGRPSHSRPGETPPRSLESIIMKRSDDVVSPLDDRRSEERIYKEASPEPSVPVHAESTSSPPLDDLDEPSSVEYAPSPSPSSPSPDEHHVIEDISAAVENIPAAEEPIPEAVEEQVCASPEIRHAEPDPPPEVEAVAVSVAVEKENAEENA